MPWQWKFILGSFFEPRVQLFIPFSSVSHSLRFFVLYHYYIKTTYIGACIFYISFSLTVRCNSSIRFICKKVYIFLNCRFYTNCSHNFGMLFSFKIYKIRNYEETLNKKAKQYNTTDKNELSEQTRRKVVNNSRKCI